VRLGVFPCGTAEKLDKIVVGSPLNSLMIHGKRQERGFKPERSVVLSEDNSKGEQEWVTRYHITEPKRISMAERRALVDRTRSLIRTVQEAFPLSEVNYLTVLTWHEMVCSDEHMTEDDGWHQA
jgi:hypothetical protein